MVYASSGTGLASASEYKFGARAYKYKLGTRADKYNLGTRADKYNLGTRVAINKVQCFIMFPPKKTPTNYCRFLKWVWHLLNLLASFRVYNKIFDKIAIPISCVLEIFEYF